MRLLYPFEMLGDKPSEHNDGELHEAAKAGDVERLRKLMSKHGFLRRKPNPNQPGWMDATPLHRASEVGHTQATEFLLEVGSDPNAERTRGDTPLHWAKNAEVAALLLDRGAQIEHRDEFSATPLHWAARYGHVSTITSLLERGANILASGFRGASALHEAKTVEVAQLLLDKGAPLTAQDDAGETPLHAAAREGSASLITFLIEAGADPCARSGSGMTPSHCAKDAKTRQLIDDHVKVKGLSVVATPTAEQVETSWQSLLRLAPKGKQAVSVTENAVLVRWGLEPSPSIDAIVGTRHQSFADLAVHPNGETFLLATVDGPVEIRRFQDLEQVGELKLPDTNARYATALAVSPCGKHLAVADDYENIHVLDASSHETLASVEGGERTGSVRFSVDGSRLGAACAFQGGAHVGLFSVGADGKLSEVAEIDRAHHQTPGEEFIDTLPSLAFSPDSKFIAFWETSAIYHELRPAGWRGNVVLCSGDTGKLIWQRSIDASITKDARSLGAADHCMGFFTELCFTKNGDAVAIGVDGQIFVLSIGDGSVLAQNEISGTVYTVAPHGDKLIAATSSGLSVCG